MESCFPKDFVAGHGYVSGYGGYGYNPGAAAAAGVIGSILGAGSRARTAIRMTAAITGRSDIPTATTPTTAMATAGRIMAASTATATAPALRLWPAIRQLWRRPWLRRRLRPRRRLRRPHGRLRRAHGRIWRPHGRVWRRRAHPLSDAAQGTSGRVPRSTHIGAPLSATPPANRMGREIAMTTSGISAIALGMAALVSFPLSAAYADTPAPAGPNAPSLSEPSPTPAWVRVRPGRRQETRQP